MGFLTSLLLAAVGLAAGWLKCIDSEPRGSWLGKIWLVGPKIDRIRPEGWALAIIIVALTGLNLILDNQEKALFDRKIADLREASENLTTATTRIEGITTKIDTTTEKNETVLNGAVDQLRKVGKGVDYSIQSLTRLVDGFEDRQKLDARIANFSYHAKRAELYYQAISRKVSFLSNVKDYLRRGRSIDQIMESLYETVKVTQNHQEIWSQMMVDLPSIELEETRSLLIALQNVSISSVPGYWYESLIEVLDIIDILELRVRRNYSLLISALMKAAVP